MWAIEQPWRPAERSLVAETPAPLLGALALAVLGALALVELGALPEAALRVTGVAAGQGALLATALGWSGAGVRAGVVAVALLALGAGAAALHPVGAVAYAGVPLWLWWRARRGAAGALGLAGPVPWGAVWAGLAVGAFLGGHLLVSVARTFGVRLRVDALDLVLAAVAYDLGANVPAAEAFFRGALFDRAQRRWPLGAAVALSTAACVTRYMLDPRLPKSVEVVVGAAFYVTLLGAANCWLFRWSGSLLPGAAAALVFFAAYRLLSPP
jgi:membrane protease YdiL (CAAX protease family)